jgi:hypothetical protein
VRLEVLKAAKIQILVLNFIAFFTLERGCHRSLHHKGEERKWSFNFDLIKVDEALSYASPKLLKLTT